MFNWTRKPDFTNIKTLDYNKYWEARGFKIKKNLRERESIMFEMIGKNCSVLDLGCGNSRLPIELKNKGCEVTVGDISEIVLRGFGSENIQAHLIDLRSDINYDLPPFNKKYNYIVLSELLEHLPDPERVIQQLSPCTDYFLITIPNSAYYRFRLGLLFKGRFFTQWVHHPSEHLRYWSCTDFADWLNALNLDILKINASNGPKLLKDLWMNMFGFQIVFLCKTK